MLPPGGSGALGSQNPGTRGFLGRSQGRPRQFSRPKHTGGTFWVWGVPPRGVWGPRLAESRDPRLPAPVRGGDPANVRDGSFGGVGLAVWGPAGRLQGPGASWACPRAARLLGRSEKATPPTCPVSALKPEKSFFAGFRATLTGCESPYFSSSGRHRPRGPTTRQ